MGLSVGVGLLVPLEVSVGELESVVVVEGVEVCVGLTEGVAVKVVEGVEDFVPVREGVPEGVREEDGVRVGEVLAVRVWP